MNRIDEVAKIQPYRDAKCVKSLEKAAVPLKWRSTELPGHRGGVIRIALGP
ncbi:MAG: hypothetical protein ISR47_08555 [Rhodospirillales bacterium]|nr:hypothetical protein [Rhodospirillales bacterium]